MATSTSALIEHTRLDTRFDGDETVHIHTEIGSTASQRYSIREERWQLDSDLGHGAHGTIWLEKTVGVSSPKYRAVKKVDKTRRRKQQSVAVDFTRELEIIARLSHPKVSSSPRIYSVLKLNILVRAFFC
jgi:hypothetical protein